jgi:hypothetical protein
MFHSDDYKLPVGIEGRLKEIVFKRYDCYNFEEIAETYFNMKYKEKNTYRWRTGMGDLICTDIMTKKHLVNTINCLTGKTKNNPIPDQYLKQCVPDNLTREDWINIFIDELKRYIK